MKDIYVVDSSLSLNRIGVHKTVAPRHGDQILCVGNIQLYISVDVHQAESIG